MGTQSTWDSVENYTMFALLSGLFARFTSLLGPKIGGTPELMPRTNYYAVNGRLEIHQNAGPQGSDGPMCYDAPYLVTHYNPVGPDMQTVQELGVSGRAFYGV